LVEGDVIGGILLYRGSTAKRDGGTRSRRHADEVGDLAVVRRR
jgi:hypothetical protein